MKKGIASILLILYVAFSSGVIINLHYCMNRFDSAQLGAAIADYCTKCGMHTSKSNGCCHDTVKIIKIDDDHQAGGYSIKFQDVSGIYVEKNYTPELQVTNNSFTNYTINHSPPINEQDTYLQNCVFRI